ncbi:hypothetical protein Pcinc_038151 [Petrolisthes cinctipes]|uniref:Uncharacterized protein n=1 Tax=Petrolisthes cinctipes TaxID=88211 RepID=A0AAE1BR39_PETCI|nr:hypothetical protein Pcinc_038151 [Petrolisthes cinctipes]
MVMMVTETDRERQEVERQLNRQRQEVNGDDGDRKTDRKRQELLFSASLLSTLLITTCITLPPSPPQITSYPSTIPLPPSPLQTTSYPSTTTSISPPHSPQQTTSYPSTTTYHHASPSFTTTNY